MASSPMTSRTLFWVHNLKNNKFLLSTNVEEIETEFKTEPLPDMPQHLFFVEPSLRYVGWLRYRPVVPGSYRFDSGYFAQDWEENETTLRNIILQLFAQGFMGVIGIAQTKAEGPVQYSLLSTLPSEERLQLHKVLKQIQEQQQNEALRQIGIQTFLAPSLLSEYDLPFVRNWMFPRPVPRAGVSPDLTFPTPQQSIDVLLLQSGEEELEALVFQEKESLLAEDPLMISRIIIKLYPDILFQLQNWVSQNKWDTINDTESLFVILFPTTEQSEAAPEIVLTPQSIDVLRENGEFLNFAQQAVTNALLFYGIKPNYDSNTFTLIDEDRFEKYFLLAGPDQSNYKRIARILAFLNLMGLHRQLGILLQVINYADQQYPDSIPKGIIDTWFQVVG